MLAKGTSTDTGRPANNRLAPPNPNKRRYLITDEGFAPRFAASLAVILSAIAACTFVPPLRSAALELYGTANDFLMATANQFMWWSLLGLLSSSCCALQILLNALSFGCAGFNAWLGPLRPAFVAMTVVAQLFSWRVAYPRPWQWRATASWSAMSVALTLLPELLAWRTFAREKSRSIGDTSGTNQRQSFTGDDGSSRATITLRFGLDTMGCASCVDTVSKVLDGMEEVRSHRVSLEEGVAEIRVGNASTDGRSPALLWDRVAKKLGAAGFPAAPLGEKKDE